MKNGTPARKQTSPRPLHSAPRSGFTLVELLVVLVIIGMLASMVSFAMFRSMQAAREAKTQALISKLHNVITRHWDTFETGQIPFSSGMEPDLPEPDDPNYEAELEAYHQTRLNAVREWMRFEMPDKSADLSDAPEKINRPLTNTVINETGAISSNAPADAQCLYRLITLLADDDLDRINLFSEDETYDILVTDTDGDGKLDAGDGVPDYFIDAWGQPIRFIRWPAGLVTDIQDRDPTKSPDPFDPTGIEAGSTYALFPLIYSWGPDKQGLVPSSTGDSDPFANPYSATSDDNDNIHNHRMNARLR